MKTLIGRLSIRTRAAILSFLIPGLGHVYLGRVARALIWFLGLILVGSIAGVEGADGWIAPVIGGVLGLCSAIDAALVAPGARRE